MSRDEDDLSAEEVKLLDLLVTLIERYEETHYAIERRTPHEILHHLMEARGLTHKDVWTLFGSKGVTSEVLHGKRATSETHARESLSRLCHFKESDPFCRKRPTMTNWGTGAVGFGWVRFCRKQGLATEGSRRLKIYENEKTGRIHFPRHWHTLCRIRLGLLQKMHRHDKTSGSIPTG
jgi:antitoxin component HigA of HigAB toxin-antitoxin module